MARWNARSNSRDFLKNRVVQIGLYMARARIANQESRLLCRVSCKRFTYAGSRAHDPRLTDAYRFSASASRSVASLYIRGRLPARSRRRKQCSFIHKSRKSVDVRCISSIVHDRICSRNMLGEFSFLHNSFDIPSERPAHTRCTGVITRVAETRKTSDHCARSSTRGGFSSRSGTLCASQTLRTSSRM
jgi:hypothetical protein